MNNQKGRDFSQVEFCNPDNENSLIYTWVWNAPINFEIIDNKLAEFQKAGISGFYILPYPKNFRLNVLVPDTEYEYLSQEFFALVKYAVEKGKRSGMEVWLYDEGGFPSGGACGKTLSENPNAMETVVCERKIHLNNGEKYVESADAIAAFCQKERIYDGYVAHGGILVTEFYAKSEDSLFPQRLNRVDSTNRGVIDTFIRNTYEEYKQSLGNAFHDAGAIFTDEPSVLTNLIPEGLFAKFFEKYQYDIRNYIYCIFDKSLAITREEQLARIHYGRLLGELFYENFCKNIREWCSQNGIRLTGHLDIDHLPEGGSRHGYFSHLRCLSAFHIPGIDVVWHQIQIPEEDRPAVEEGTPFFPRLASSAAHQSGGNLAVTESFAVYGDGLTPDEFRYVLNYQAVRGINVFNVMITTAGDERMQALVQRPVFTSRKPGFYNMEHMNAYYKRLSYLLRLGETQIDTALYIPCADFWTNEEQSKKASKAYIDKGSALENRNIEFDIIDDYAILSAQITDDGLMVGDMLYKNIVVPSCAFMPDEVHEKIKPFIRDYEAKDDSSGIRMMKRKLSSGMMYFIFNERAESAKVATDNLGDEDDVLYRVNALSGEITKLNGNEIEVLCGDIAILYATGYELDTKSEEIEYEIECKDFTIARIKQFEVTLDGISMNEVPKDTEITNKFSGEVTYRLEYELPNTPKASERYKIVLLDTALSARILIDGQKVATVGLTPMEAIVRGDQFNRHGVMEITVANTAANEIVSKIDLIDFHPKTMIGPYSWHETSLQYEKRVPALRFGRIKICKLKDGIER